MRIKYIIIILDWLQAEWPLTPSNEEFFHNSRGQICLNFEFKGLIKFSWRDVRIKPRNGKTLALPVAAITSDLSLPSPSSICCNKPTITRGKYIIWILNRPYCLNEPHGPQHYCFRMVDEENIVVDEEIRVQITFVSLSGNWKLEIGALSYFQHRHFWLSFVGGDYCAWI